MKLLSPVQRGTICQCMCSANPAPAALPRLAPTLNACGCMFSRINLMDAATASMSTDRSVRVSNSNDATWLRGATMMCPLLYGYLLSMTRTSRFSNRTSRSRRSASVSLPKQKMHAFGSESRLRKYAYRQGAHSRSPSAGTSASSRRLTTRFFGAIYFDSEFLARTKKWNLLGIDADQLPRLGIASLPRATLLHREAAEAADFDPLAARQRGGHRVEHCIHDRLRLAMRKLLPARK